MKPQGRWSVGQLKANKLYPIEEAWDYEYSLSPEYKAIEESFAEEDRVIERKTDWQGNVILSSTGLASYEKRKQRRHGVWYYEDALIDARNRVLKAPYTDRDTVD